MNTDKDRIIFVHGMKPKPRPEDHCAMLWRCLLDGVRRADAAVAEQLASNPDIFVLGAWSRLLYDQHTSIEPDIPGIERLLDLPGPEDEDIREAMHWHKRIGQLIYLLSDAFPVLIDLVANPNMKATLQDARRYFRNENGVATRIRGLVADSLIAATEAGQRVLLIGHSLGSVIAYDVLWELSRRRNSNVRIDQFLTIGSPLGVNFVQHRMLGSAEHGERRYPDNIRTWRNLSAIGEMTALDRRMAKDFAPMQKAGLVESISDDIELINYFRGPDGLNVHKCYGYMANEKTGAVLVEWLRSAADSLPEPAS